MVAGEHASIAFLRIEEIVVAVLGSPLPSAPRVQVPPRPQIAPWSPLNFPTQNKRTSLLGFFVLAVFVAYSLLN